MYKGSPKSALFKKKNSYYLWFRSVHTAVRQKMRHNDCILIDTWIDCVVEKSLSKTYEKIFFAAVNCALFQDL